jgi:NTE family protein
MADMGLDVRNAELFVGTSAGARVVLELTSGNALEEIYQRRVGPELPPLERSPMVDWVRLRADLAAAKQAGGSPAEILRRYGALALTVAVGKGSDRREIVATQLPVQAWPKQRVLIVAVNAETGERRAFDHNSGIDLVDAVVATTASFGWPPTLFDGHHYIDGGYYSSDNADLATGFERVLILALRRPPYALSLVPLDHAVVALRAAGARVEVIHPDEETLETLASTGGAMNPASGKPAAMAGRLQVQRSVSEQIASFWR